MKKNLSLFLPRLFILLLVVFMAAGTLTGQAETLIQTNEEKQTKTILHPDFPDLTFIDADSNKIILEAVQEDFDLNLNTGTTQTYSDGMLYKATTYAKTDSTNSNPTAEYPAKYTPPVLVVSPGNTINLTLRNSLPVLAPQGSAVPAVQYNLEAVSQDTNLHYHGFNVSPLLGSDDVVIHVHSSNTSKENSSKLPIMTGPGALSGSSLNSEGANFPIGTGGPDLEPINEYKMTVNIPEGHQKGLFWYHPHVHGDSDRQVQYGMSGGIIVRGIGEAFPILKNITREQDDDYGQVMLFKYFKEKFFNDGTGTGKFFTLNDAQDPEIDIAKGDVQLWRIADISADNYLNLTFIDPSADGNNHSSTLSLPKFEILSRDASNTYFTSDGTENNAGQAEFVDSILVPPAGRVELLMDASQLSPGSSYELVSVKDNLPHPYKEGDNLGGNGQPKIDNLASLEVTQGAATALTSNFTELFSDNNVCEKTVNPRDCLRNLNTKELAGEEILPDPDTLADYSYCDYSAANDQCVVQKHTSDPNDKFEFVFNSTYLDPAPGQQKNKVFNMNDELYDGVRIDKVVNVGTNQEWTLTNSEVGDHAFHIHQLDFITTEVNVPTDYIENRNGAEYYDNYSVNCENATLPDGTSSGKHCKYNQYGYRDTVNLPANSSTVVRIPFVNPFITGVFVYHCHILGHEDTGMMQNIQVVNPNSYIPPALLEQTSYQLKNQKNNNKSFWNNF